MTWLRHVPRESGMSGGAEVLAGPGADPVRWASRVNVILSAVRRFLLHGAAAGSVPAEILPALYEVSGNRDLPAAARPEDGLMLSRLRARHRLRAAVERVPSHRAPEGTRR